MIGVPPVGHSLDLDEPALTAGGAGIAGEFRHGISGMAVLVFLDPDPGLDLSFDDILGEGDGPLVHGQAGAQLHRPAPQSSRR